jgi:hypothetical protein
VSNSYIQLTAPENSLHLLELQRDYYKRNFVNEPLIFLNSCESGGMSPLFYDGFMPYFITKGSRGVIGTLAKVPAIIASEFGVEFFKKLLKGENAGRALLRVRNHFLETNSNLLGLYYASYGLSDLSLAGKLKGKT